MRVIGGILKGRKIECPKGLLVRPTSAMLRESIFNICQQQVVSARFLDLYAGSGAMGIEALSRGAQEVVFVDRSVRAMGFIKKNLAHLGVTKHTRVFIGDAKHVLRKVLAKQDPFDLIYIDPPYKFFESTGYLEALFEDLLEGEILSPSGTIFVEERYSKSAKESPVLFPSFSLVQTKKVGNALLCQYRLES